jgi:hypothetical protein
MKIYRSDQKGSHVCHYLPVARVLLNGYTIQEADHLDTKGPARDRCLDE